MKRRLLPALLALVMVLGLLPMAALAADSDTVITENNAVITGVHDERVVIKTLNVTVRDATLNGGLTADVSIEGCTVTITGASVVAKMEINGDNSKVVLEKGVSVESLNVAGKDADVEIRGKVETVTIAETAEGASVSVTETATVAAVENNAPASSVVINGTVESLAVGETATGATITVGETAAVAEVEVKAEDVTMDVAKDADVGTVTAPADVNLEIIGDGKGDVEVKEPEPEDPKPAESENPGNVSSPAVVAIVDKDGNVVGYYSAGKYEFNEDQLTDGKPKYAAVQQKNGKLTAYETVKDATAAVEKTETAVVTLVNDSTEDWIKVDKGSVTLDLADKTLAAKVYVWGDSKGATRSDTDPVLTIKSTGGKGKIIKTGDYQSDSKDFTAVVIQDGGKVILESGTIVAAKLGEDGEPVKGAAAQSSGGRGVSVWNAGEFVMSGGKVEAGWFAIESNGTADPKSANYAEGAKFTIGGGTVISHGDIGIYVPQKGGVVEISNAVVSGFWGALLARDGDITLTTSTFKNLAGTAGYEGSGTKDWSKEVDGSEVVASNPAVIIIPNYVKGHGADSMSVKVGTIALPNGGFVVTNTSKQNVTTYTEEQLKTLAGVTGIQAQVIQVKETAEVDMQTMAQELSVDNTSFAYMSAHKNAFELNTGEFLQVDTNTAALMLKDLEAEIKEAAENSDQVFNTEDVKLYWTKTGEGKDLIVLIGVTKDAAGNEYSLPGQSVLVTVEIPEGYTGKTENVTADVTVTAKAPTYDAFELDADAVAEAIKQAADAAEAAKQAAEEKAAADAAAADAVAEKAAAEEAVKQAGNNAEAKAEAEKVLAEAEQKVTETTEKAAEAEKAVENAEAAKADSVVEEQVFTDIASGTITITINAPEADAE